MSWTLVGRYCTNRQQLYELWPHIIFPNTRIFPYFPVFSPIWESTENHVKTLFSKKTRFFTKIIANGKCYCFIRVKVGVRSVRDSVLYIYIHLTPSGRVGWKYFKTIPMNLVQPWQRLPLKLPSLLRLSLPGHKLLVVALIVGRAIPIYAKIVSKCLVANH